MFVLALIVFALLTALVVVGSLSAPKGSGHTVLSVPVQMTVCDPNGKHVPLDADHARAEEIGMSTCQQPVWDRRWQSYAPCMVPGCLSERRTAV